MTRAVVCRSPTIKRIAHVMGHIKKIESSHWLGAEPLARDPESYFSVPTAKAKGRGSASYSMTGTQSKTLANEEQKRSCKRCSEIQNERSHKTCSKSPMCNINRNLEITCRGIAHEFPGRNSTSTESVRD